MAIITGATVELADDPDGEIAADCHGNNAAVACPECSQPVLLIARTHHRGSRRDRASICQGCGVAIWIVSPVDAGLRVDPLRIDSAPPDEIIDAGAG